MILVMALVAVEPPAPPAPTTPRLPTVEIVVPTHNEAHVLEASVARLSPVPRPSTSRCRGASRSPTTAAPTARRSVARRLARTLPGVAVLVLPTAGRGGALRTAWMRSRADIVAYTDVDLSTDLDALLPLVAPLISGHSDVAVGSRLACGRPHQPRPEARAHLPRLQPPAAARAADAGARRPVRLQGDERRRRPPAPADRPRRRLVLRHRAA